MLKTIFKFSSLFIAGALVLSSCKKDDVITSIDTTNTGNFKVFTQGNVTTVQNLIADTIVGISPLGQPYGTGKYSFYSIENNALVPSTDSATNRWDIAFRGTSILTNAGTSGPGNGGAFVQIGTFDAIASVSADSVFRVDAAPAYAIPLGSGKGWYNYNGATNLLTPIPGRVMMIRTASGKYAKLEILNYYKTGVTPASSASDDIKINTQRYYNFRYTFQSNGSTTF